SRFIGLPIRTAGSLTSICCLTATGGFFCCSGTRCWRCRRRRGRSGCPCRLLCSLSPAFRNVVSFGDLCRLIRGLVGSPLLSARLDCLFLRKRRCCGKCKTHKYKSKASEQ